MTERQEALKDVLKIMVMCRDKTDVWADEERWNKFERMFRKELKAKINELKGGKS